MIIFSCLSTIIKRSQGPVTSVNSSILFEAMFLIFEVSRLPGIIAFLIGGAPAIACTLRIRSLSSRSILSRVWRVISSCCAKTDRSRLNLVKQKAKRLTAIKMIAIPAKTAERILLESFFTQTLHGYFFEGHFLDKAPFYQIISID